ncbi:MAG TPA: hypothetical protein PKD51_14020 [Saprospiraceae bacterium]|nr:hypothetical protein [Saprospiraceae bacterium]HMU02692.1 hypothetical protein [Saprospiraceae bacterium]
MRLAFRLFSAFLLLEMMCLYHCFGQDVQQVSYPSQTNIHSNVDQVSPSEFSLMDLIEFLEGKDGDENSEEDTEHNLSSTNEIQIHLEINNEISDIDQNSIHRLLNFKENKYPLFVLFHSWKLHIA